MLLPASVFTVAFDVGQRQVARDFVRHQKRNFFYQVAEIARAGIFVAQHGNFVLNQRVIHYV